MKKKSPHKKGDEHLITPIRGLHNREGESLISSLIPSMEDINYDIVRVEVVEKVNDIAVHIYPLDPKILLPQPPDQKSPLRRLCEQILPSRFPELPGPAEYSVVREYGIPASACIVMPLTHKYVWAPDYFRMEFPRLIAQGLAGL